jgi:hypothetical protein
MLSTNNDAPLSQMLHIIQQTFTKILVFKENVIDPDGNDKRGYIIIVHTKYLYNYYIKSTLTTMTKGNSFIYIKYVPGKINEIM